MHNFDFLLKEYVYDRNKQQIQRRIIDKQTVNETLEYSSQQLSFAAIP